MVGDMELLIEVDELAPPTGRVTHVRDPRAGDGLPDQLIFSGWLGLLRALSQSIGDGAMKPPPEQP